MRSSALARVLMAGLGAAVVISLGCDKPKGGPSPLPTFSVRAISPAEGSSVGGTVATIEGDRFQYGDFVAIDGVRVDATVLTSTTISLTMPAHAAGKAAVTVTRIDPISQAPISLYVGFRYQ